MPLDHVLGSGDPIWRVRFAIAEMQCTSRSKQAMLAWFDACVDLRDLALSTISELADAERCLAYHTV
jgi:hypothetical protein